MNTTDLSNLVITKVHSVSTMYTPEDTILKRTDRSCWAVVIKYEGETVYTSNGTQMISDSNHIVILPKGCSYDWHCTRSGHFSIIEFESELSFREPFVFFVKNSEKILKKFKELEYKRNLRMPMVELESIMDTYGIIMMLLQTMPGKYASSDKQRIITPVIEYISQNYNKTITNDILACVAGVSTVYFRKLFTQVVGVSPMTFVHDLRIEKAKEMLKSDYSTLSDIGQSLG